MGGMLATRMALMYPNEVEKLILVNPIGLEDWKLKVPYKNVHDLYQIELKNSEEKIRDYQKNVYFDGKWKPEYDKGIEILVGWTKHPDYPKVAWNAALTTDMCMLQPVLYEFKNLKMPTLLLLGTRDRTALGKAWADPKTKDELGRYDRLGKEVIKLIPKGKLVELHGIGHMPQIENYDAYIKNIKGFL
jgi:pimeloyl-ACP methyl ester carboxylesterase